MTVPVFTSGSAVVCDSPWLQALSGRTLPLESHSLSHYIERAVFRLTVDPTNILANDAKANQLDPTEKEDRDCDTGPALDQAWRKESRKKGVQDSEDCQARGGQAEPSCYPEGWPQLPLAEAPMRLLPTLKGDLDRRCYGFELEAILPDGRRHRCSFSIYSLGHVASRAARR